MTHQHRDVDAAYTTAPPEPAPSEPAKKRLGWRPLTAIITGGVLVLALTFGGGMATAWGLGLVGGPASGFGGTGLPDRGTPPDFGNGGPSGDGTVPAPGRRDDTDDDGTTGGTAPNA